MLLPITPAFEGVEDGDAAHGLARQCRTLGQHLRLDQPDEVLSDDALDYERRGNVDNVLDGCVSSYTKMTKATEALTVHILFAPLREPPVP